MLLVLAHRSRRSEPRLAGRIFGGLRLFDFDAVLRKSGLASNGFEHTSEETNERRSGSHRR